MKNDDKKEKILALIILATFIIMTISIVAIIMYSIHFIIYSFQNPELTRTQVVIHMIKDTPIIKWAACTIISYLIMFFYSQNH